MSPTAKKIVDAVSNANHPDSSAAQNGRDALPRAQDRGGSRTRLCRRPCGDARTGACAQKAQRTVDASLVQFIDMIIDVPIVKGRQALSIQGAEDVGSSSDSAPLVQHAQKTVEMPSSSSSTRWLMQMQVPAAQVAQKTGLTDTVHRHSGGHSSCEHWQGPTVQTVTKARRSCGDRGDSTGCEHARCAAAF